MSPPVDRKTIDRLVVEHLPAALRFALRLTGDPQIAEDVVQEALCRVLRCWRTFRGEASFGTWMLQIVVNVDRDRRRQQRTVLPIAADEVASSAASPVAEAAANELRARVLAEIHRLPQRQREVAVLSLGEGLPAPQVARLLETTEANVHTCLHLARRRIARAIGFNYVGQNAK